MKADIFLYLCSFKCRYQTGKANCATCSCAVRMVKVITGVANDTLLTSHILHRLLPAFSRITEERLYKSLAKSPRAGSII